jgi:5-methylcytosine-specific restriction enzyme A
MSTIDDLKPVHRALVMDLLAEAGFDVSDWKNYKGRSPAANPKYSYNWAFEQPGEAIAVCLWYRSLSLRGREIAHHRKPRASASGRKDPTASLWRMRNAEFGARLELDVGSSCRSGSSLSMAKSAIPKTSTPGPLLSRRGGWMTLLGQ